NLPQEQIVGNFFAGAQVSWTIFDTLTTWAKVRDAEYQRIQADYDERRTRFQVGSEVEAARARLVGYLKQRSQRAQVAEVSRDNLGILEKRYAAGQALILELLDAQVQLLQSDFNVVDGNVALALADAELAAALGRL